MPEEMARSRQRWWMWRSAPVQAQGASSCPPAPRERTQSRGAVSRQAAQRLGSSAADRRVAGVEGNTSQRRAGARALVLAPAGAGRQQHGADAPPAEGPTPPYTAAGTCACAPPPCRRAPYTQSSGRLQQRQAGAGASTVLAALPVEKRVRSLNLVFIMSLWATHYLSWCRSVLGRTKSLTARSGRKKAPRKG